jgi:hypothetical protein
MPLETAAVTVPPEYLTSYKYRIRCDHCGKPADHWQPGVDAAHEQAVQEGFGKGKQGWLCKGCNTGDEQCRSTVTAQATAKPSKSKRKSKKRAPKRLADVAAMVSESVSAETSPLTMANS